LTAFLYSPYTFSEFLPKILGRFVLGSLIRNLILAGLLIFLAQFSAAQSAPPSDASKPAASTGASKSVPAEAAPAATDTQPSKLMLDSNETLFATFAALNACGYDADLSQSNPVREQVRTEVSQAIHQSDAAGSATQELCNFYRDHHQGDSARDAAQYVSLALNLDQPPQFNTKLKEADMPPDASYVLGFIPLLKNFYSAVGVHEIWERHQKQYDAIIAALQEPIANVILATDVYLKVPSSGYVGRQFIVYMEPMVAPAHVNARNYAADYFMVISPEAGRINLTQVRHTYLHFLLDPLALKRATAMKNISPILKEVQTAPLDDSFKRDVTLLVTESLIRAVEAHEIPGKNADEQRQKAVNESMSAGYVLTRYFFDQLTSFANSPTGLNSAYPDWLYTIDVGKERKRASQVTFAKEPAPEVLSTTAYLKKDPLDLAEQKLGEGDVGGAQKLAQAVLNQQGPDPARALFILGQAASLNRDVDSAVTYFEQTIQVSKQPRLTAWSHIYLGRIYDMQDERDTAVQHYKAALQAGDDSTKPAAERGLKEAFHHAPQQGTKQDQ
jgi:hypothetical protein